MKKIIGLVPSANNLFKTEFVYEDKYCFTNNYIQRITESGAIVSGVLACDGYIDEETLKLYDGFVMSGGSRVLPYHIQVIDYAVKNNKPFLGICMGMQALAIYFFLIEEKKKSGFEGTIIELFEKYLEEEYQFTTRVEGHDNARFRRNNVNIDEVRHKVILEKDSILYNLFKTDTISMPSMHGLAMPYVVEPLKITGRAEDGTIEVIEYNDKIFGVQFHLENESINDCIFKYIINKC